MAAAPWPVERYRALLRMQARQLRLDPRLRRRFDSSDLVQETMVKALENLDQFRGPNEAALVRWLQRIFCNVVIDKIRHARAQERDPAMERYVEESMADSTARMEKLLMDDRSSPSEQAQRRELLLRLADALEQLPDDQAEVFVQRDLRGASVGEIAAQLGRTEKSVAGLLLRARRSLRDLLAEFAP
jgi:RNA polymerase sigma-70 factor (ECF subfamily)